MKCLVTGATGFIGRELCVRLQQGGHEVVAFSRGGGSVTDSVSTTAVDLASELIDPAQLNGVDVVFHLAGIAHTRAPEADYEWVNHRATLALAEAALAAGVERFVFLSSVKAMGALATATPRLEDDCHKPGDPYSISKLRAENGLRLAYAQSTMAVVILRPPLVYGEGARGNLAALASGIRRGLPRPPAAGSRSMIGRSDLVGVLLAVAQAPLRGVQTWLVTDGETYTFQRCFDALASGSGRTTQRVWLPLWCWWLAAACYDVLRHLTGKAGGDESTFDKLFGDACYDNSAIRASIDWQPQYTLESTLGEEAVATEAITAKS